MRCIGKSIVIHVDHHLDNLSHLKIVITSQKYSILFSSQCVFDSNVYLLTLILSFVVRSAVNLDIYLPKLAVFGSCFCFPNDWHLFLFYWPASNSSKSDRMNMQIFHSKSSHTNTLKHMPIHIPFFFDYLVTSSSWHLHCRFRVKCFEDTKIISFVTFKFHIKIYMKLGECFHVRHKFYSLRALNLKRQKYDSTSFLYCYNLIIPNFIYGHVP